jgi:predicted esterase
VRASADHLDEQSGLRATLTGDGELADAKAVALVLHGGKEMSHAAAAARQVAVLRMAPIARHLVAAGANRGLAVWRLRFRYRGWNQESAHAIEDVEWALHQLRLRHPTAPIVMVGHSMGGRAALRAAGETGVAGVVGLAPWLPADEPHDQIAGRRVLVVHGSRDHVTSAKRSRDFVSGVRSVAGEAAFVGLRGCGHAMVRRVWLWNRLTSEFVLYAGLGTQPHGALAEALARGELVL